MKCFKITEVKAIINTIGGYNSHQLLEYIDYNLIKQNPKIILGYSDFTAILLAIHKKSELITFMGPALLPQFGEYGGMLEYTKKIFKDVLMTQNDEIRIPPSKYWTSEFLAWDIEDNRPRQLTKNEGPLIIKEGRARGSILAGNMGTMLLLAGTSLFQPLITKYYF